MDPIIADSFCVMDRGSIVADGPMSRLSDEVVKRYQCVMR